MFLEEGESIALIIMSFLPASSNFYSLIFFPFGIKYVQYLSSLNNTNKYKTIYKEITPFFYQFLLKEPSYRPIYLFPSTLIVKEFSIV